MAERDMDAGIRSWGERGATALIVAIVIVMLFGFGALAIDIAHLFLSRSELQNAADACALRGAGVLYYDLENDEYVEAPQETANQEAHDAGVANQSQGTGVEINWTYPGNTGTDVERGHWNFATNAFAASDSLAVTVIANRTMDDLNADTDFINAVRCVTRREATPVTNFLAPVLNIFGGDFTATVVHAEAIAVVGFAGRLEPKEVDAPIGICRDKIYDPATKTYTCNIGRMLNDSSSASTSESAMWTLLDTSDSSSCSGLPSTSATTGRSYLATEPVPDNPGCFRLVGNPDVMTLGGYVSTNNGVIDALVSQPSQVDLMDAWKSACDDLDGAAPLDRIDGADSDDLPEHSWELTLPVIDCSSSTCNEIKGAVTVKIVWIRDGNDPHYTEVPLQMDGWSCTDPATGVQMTRTRVRDWNTPIGGLTPGEYCWNGFVSYFNLKNTDGLAAPYDNSSSKAIYFKPSCEAEVPTGHTGGENYGILAKYPALVQ